MRVWDALLSEGTKILYRVALALLKTHEDRLLAQDNAGYVQREMKLASAGMHDRDALMKVRAVRPCNLALLPESDVLCMAGWSQTSLLDEGLSSSGCVGTYFSSQGQCCFQDSAHHSEALPDACRAHCVLHDERWELLS